MLLFFAAIIEFGVIVGEFMAKFGYFAYSDTNCKLVTFIIHGNRILQISTALTMLYYNMLAAYLKTTKFQLLTKRYFLVLVLSLLTLETLMVLSPTLGIRSSISEQWCEFVHPDVSTRSRTGWLYTVLSSYFIFYLLYFILMTARQVEFLVDMSQMHRLMGVSVMFITRPLFTLI